MGLSEEGDLLEGDWTYYKRGYAIIRRGATSNIGGGELIGKGNFSTGGCELIRRRIVLELYLNLH